MNRNGGKVECEGWWRYKEADVFLSGTPIPAFFADTVVSSTTVGQRCGPPSLLTVALGFESRLVENIYYCTGQFSESSLLCSGSMDLGTDTCYKS